MWCGSKGAGGDFVALSGDRWISEGRAVGGKAAVWMPQALDAGVCCHRNGLRAGFPCRHSLVHVHVVRWSSEHVSC